MAYCCVGFAHPSAWQTFSIHDDRSSVTTRRGVRCPPSVKHGHLLKQLDHVPEVICRKFRIWVALVEESGIREVRKLKGFRDESLKGR